MSQFSDELVRIAATQIGVHEQPHGSNDGPEVKKYLASAGLTKPNSWCMSFIYWCANIASANISKPNPLLRTGSVMRQWEANHLAVGTAINPQKGDIFILNHGHGLGHAGIVESVDQFGIHTIEGNSNTDGSRDGEAVVSNYRKFPIHLLEGYLRF